MGATIITLSSAGYIFCHLPLCYNGVSMLLFNTNLIKYNTKKLAIHKSDNDVQIVHNHQE